MPPLAYLKQANLYQYPIAAKPSHRGSIQPHFIPNPARSTLAPNDNPAMLAALRIKRYLLGHEMKNVLISIGLAAVTLGAAGCASLRSPREAENLREVIGLLRDADSLYLRDIARDESGLGIIEYPYAVEGQEAIRQVAKLIEEADFQLNEQLTQSFRGGAAVDANVFLEVLIDDKVSFMIFTATWIKTSNLTIYSPQEKHYRTMDKSFAKDFNRLIKKIGSKPQQTDEPYKK